MLSSSSTPSLISCGTTNQPWKLEAPAGQQINVSLLDFGLQDAAGARERNVNQHQCHQQFGFIVDKAAAAKDHKNVSICGVREERTGVVHQSVSNVLEIILSLFQDATTGRDEAALIGFTGFSFNALSLLKLACI